MKNTLIRSLLLLAIVLLGFAFWIGGSFGPKEDVPFEPGLIDLGRRHPDLLAPYVFSEPRAWASMVDCVDGEATEYYAWCLRNTGTYTRSEYHEVLTAIDLLGGQMAAVDLAPTLSSVAANGRFILNSNSEANATVIACVDMSDPLDGDCSDATDLRVMEWCDSVVGSCIRKVNPENHTDITISDTFSFRLFSESGGLLQTWTAAGAHSLSNAAQYQSKVGWGAGAIEVDGTQCTEANKVSEVLSSGPKKVTIRCADSNSSIIYGSTPGMMPRGWTEGTVEFCIEIWHGTTENITLAGDFQCQCHGDGEAVSSTWNTPDASSDADVSITTANRYERACSAALTCAGTCAAEDIIDWKYTVDAANTSANAANTRIMAVQMMYTRDSDDDY